MNGTANNALRKGGTVSVGKENNAKGNFNKERNSKKRNLLIITTGTNHSRYN